MNEQRKRVEFVNDQLNYQEIAASEEFNKLLAMKKRFTILVTSFFMVFALLLPILAFYTDMLTRMAFGPISWGWVYAFAQFIMTWIICQVYIKKAAQFDEMAKYVLEQGGRS